MLAPVEPAHQAAHTKFNMSLDLVLLELLFTKSHKAIEKLALELTINNFNQKSNLKTQLIEV
jgi:hypothetical protein